MQIEQDQRVAVLAVQLADLVRIHRGRDGGIAGTAQHALQQLHIGFPIIHDQDTGVKNIVGTNHHIDTGLITLANPASANSIATSSASMNSLTLIGLVI